MQMAIKNTLIAIVITALPLHLFAENPICPAMAAERSLVDLVPGTYEIKGLNAEGLSVVGHERDAFRQRTRLFGNEFRGLTALHRQLTLARLFAGNAFMSGPSGGAKSGVVNWFMRGSSGTKFKLQLNPLTPETAFIGSQNFEAAKLGKFQMNFEGSMAAHEEAHLDEIDKGGPQALGSLLGVLNEREVLGGEVYKSPLQIVYATSNANIAEIVEALTQNGMATTAQALLNRFQFKSFIYNWLADKDQAFLDARVAKKKYLKSLSYSHPEVLNDEVFMTPEELQWNKLRRLVHSIIKPTPLFKATVIELENELRTRTNEAKRASEALNRKNRDLEPFVLFPSLDWTERIRQDIPEMVMMSAFLDFLDSPMADDANLEDLRQHPIELDPLSLWRMAYIGTVGPGDMHLKFDLEGSQKVDIDFDWKIDPSSARDNREEHLIKNLVKEQMIFRNAFVQRIEAIQSQIELRARNNSQFNNRIGAKDTTSFELKLARSRGE